LVKSRIPKRFGLNPIRDIQVLCPMNRGGADARSLNIELQAALNPAGERKVERFGWTFAPDDKVMQIENDYDKEVYNGDIGYVSDVDPEAGELMASFDGRSVTYGFGELDTLVPAYAATIHKSQGSEYPAVIIPVSIELRIGRWFWMILACARATLESRSRHSVWTGALILNVQHAPRALFKLARDLAAVMALHDLGVSEEGIGRTVDLALANPYWNPRALERGPLGALPRDAWEGRSP
jgi:hypothetical protein